MHLIRILILAFGSALFLGGCAHPDPTTGPVTESSIPWNRPANWEGTGALGGISGMGSR